ncbi:MAG TPA: acetoacetate--CoA ligase [Devosia sp.]|nr:acetoacetate--CoA ligase [Devosia sp.]
MSEGRIGEVVWQPDAQRVAACHLAKFARLTSHAPTDYEALHSWSIAEPEAFHSRLWDFLGIVGDKGERAYAAGATLRQTRFFPDAQLNYAENLLHGIGDRLAIISHREDGTRRAVTGHELADLVSRAVQALRAEGVDRGDRIAAIVTNDLEAAVLYLASAAIGSIWASCSPDFGPAGAADRLNQLDPKLLIAVPSYRYNGKLIDTAQSVEAVAASASVGRIILVGSSNRTYSRPSISWDDWLAPYGPAPIVFERLPFETPLVILFSSGTTGKPKCIVHSAGGLLLQHRKEHVLHCDLSPGDTLFYYTTCGWMMWNWLLTGLASGLTIVTYDGNPAFPDLDRMPALIEAERITAFGTSAKFLDACNKAGLVPRERYPLESLKLILSTGSPLLPQSFDHVYNDWKADIHLASISGGTDICACFLGGIPVWPVRRGELQGALLGMDVAALSPGGVPVEQIPGELVCRNAHLSMPVSFWNDPDGAAYDRAYFQRFPGYWAHGDLVEEHLSRGFVILGRSDTTLNPGGVRIGTAEIYRQVEAIPEILESVAVGQDWEGDQRIVLFVRLRDGQVLSSDLEATIRAKIRAGATPRHVPARIIAVPDIPRTRSGKISEAAVRDTIHNQPIANDTALANAECLVAYRDLPELQR